MTEIVTKSSQNTYEKYKLVNFWNLKKETDKIIHHYVKIIDFCQIYMKFVVAMATTKMVDKEMTYGERQRSSYKTFQPLRVNRPFKTLKKPYEEVYQFYNIS